MFSPSEDKGALAKLVEAIKTNYNDRCEEVSIWSVSLWLKFNNLRKKLHNFNCFTNSLPRSAVTGEAASWVPNPQLASTSWRRQRPRNWQPSLVKMFGIKNVLTEQVSLLHLQYFCTVDKFSPGLKIQLSEYSNVLLVNVDWTDLI